MEFQILVSNKCDATLQHYWSGIRVWLNNPHLINKRVLSSKIILQIELLGNIESVLSNISNNNHIAQFITDVNKNLSNLIDEFTILTENIDVLGNDKNGIYLIVKKLFPRDSDNFSTTVDFTIIDKNSQSLISLQKPLESDKRSLGLDWPYKIIYSNHQLDLLILNTENLSNNSGVQWLQNKVNPCLMKWIESTDESKNSFVKGSLNLIPIDNYCILYNNLKKKYGTELVEKWPECTDPKKFVYEDIAIATYLLVLWEKERLEKGIDRKQSFVDLGCGNGLLVYILTNEGHKGLGIDLRRRKIWNLFSQTPLEERTIIPSSSSLFPDTDWLIGNHSDELTPWIPVIAARSSYNCRFFLLPCCAHEFDGRKFQRDCASNSQYFEYLNYVESISVNSGFNVAIDKLRIPSTKRICFIGWSRSYPVDKSNQQDDEIERIINARSIDTKLNNKIPNSTSQEWSQDFKPRDTVEKVRNCTQINRNIIDEIVNLVADNLLHKVRLINSNEQSQKPWNAGGRIELSEIAKIVPEATRKQLKNECGGLQTLLRNNSHIFHIHEGTVQFRIPGSQLVSKKKRSKSNLQLRVKPCWFFVNHPDGCPVSSEKCNFKH